MLKKIKRGFASDNNAGVHPLVFAEMGRVNLAHEIGYGDDRYTSQAIAKLKEEFGEDTSIYFVFNGTAANVLCLKAMTESYHSIITTETAHLHVDECGAVEKITGCKVLTNPSKDGKLTVNDIKTHLHGIGFEHHSQPKVVSITQTTELGTVYSPEELKKICDFAHANELMVHMDGARLYNAAAYLELPLRSISKEVSIDALSLGATKIGGMYGEAVLFFQPELTDGFKYYRKQTMQLGSKMRFISAQFNALFTDELWRKNALHANRMANYLAENVEALGVKITQKVQSNGVFAILPAEIVPKLQKEYFFYIWDEAKSEIRWMTSFDTQKEDIDNFVKMLRKLLR